MVMAEKTLFSLTDAAGALNAQTSTLQDTMNVLAKSKLWNIISRGASGILPNFWSIQNKFRAVTIAFQLYYEQQEEGNKKLIESVKAQSLLDKAMGSLNQNLLEFNDKRFAQMQKYENVKNAAGDMVPDVELASQKWHELAMHTQDGIEEYQMIYARASEYFERKADNKEIIWGVDEKTQEERDRGIEKRAKKMAKRHTKAIMQPTLDAMKQAKERSIKALEYEETIEKIRKGDSKWTEVRSEKLKHGLTGKAVGAIKEKSGFNKLKKGFIDTMSTKTDKGGTEKRTKFGTMMAKREEAFKSGKKLTPMSALELWIFKKKALLASVWASSKIVLRALGKFLKGAMMWFIGIVLGVTLIVMLLKSMWPELKKSWKFIKFYLSMIVDGIVSVVTGLWNIIAGALTGDFMRVFEGVIQIFTGVMEVVFGILGALFMTGLAMLGAVLSGLIGAFMDSYEEKNGKLKAVLNKTADLLLWLAIIAAAIIFLGSGAWAVFLTAHLGAVIVTAIAALGTKLLLGGMADGGTVTEPMTLVGEKGPELVSLPKGSMVHSNEESTEILNESNVEEQNITNLTENKTVENITNITVQVQGRVGASDAEIKDIANKVAREINLRMNRTSTTPSRFA